MLEKTFMGERDFSRNLQKEITELSRENAELKERIAHLESQLRWTEAELSRRT
jgi:cell division protein FtsB